MAFNGPPKTTSIAKDRPPTPRQPAKKYAPKGPDRESIDRDDPASKLADPWGDYFWIAALFGLI